jgi:hypothetical protein
MKKKKVHKEEGVVINESVSERALAMSEILPPTAEVIEKVLITGDLASLSPSQRLSYYNELCNSLGLNPLTKPFAYINLDRGLTLYALKDCTEQLRRLYNISLKIVSREITDGVYVVTAQARLLNGRQDESIGGVPIGSLAPQARANSMMKAETKAKRRVTLSICGLGMFDESELDLMHDYQTFDRDEDIKANIEKAAENRLEDSAAQNGDTARTPATDKSASDSAQPVTDKNYGDVICHIGKAEGDMLGRKVSELPEKVLMWLNDNYEKRWAQLTSDKDKRLITAVRIALDTIREARASVGVTTEQTPQVQKPVNAPAGTTIKISELPPPALTKQGLVDLLVLRAQQSLGIDERHLSDVLIEQGLLDEETVNLGDKPTLIHCSLKTLRLLERADQWKIIENLVIADREAEQIKKGNYTQSQ